MINQKQKDMFLRHLSDIDFASLGLDQIAYVREITIEGETVYSLNSADGRLLSMQTTPDLAASIARTNNLSPLTVH